MLHLAAQALVQLCGTSDPETLRFTLLTLELLAIESSDVVCAQVCNFFFKELLYWGVGGVHYRH